MFWVILVSLVILGLAYLIRKFADEIVEVRNTFFIIIGIFIVLYVGAAIFVSYNLKAWSAQRQDSPFTNDPSAYAKQDTIKEVDLSTGP